MTCCNQTLIQPVCYTNAAGVKATLLAHYTYGASTGAIPSALIRTVYTDAAGVPVNTAGGTVVAGACPISAPDVFRIVQPLVAGDNVIAHNFGSAPVEVEVRNNASGAIVTARVVAESPNSVTINVPVAVALARISLDA